MFKYLRNVYSQNGSFLKTCKWLLKKLLNKILSASLLKYFYELKMLLMRFDKSLDLTCHVYQFFLPLVNN